jgi:hypothetical protein
MHKNARYSLWIAGGLLVALIVALFLRSEAPPEAARLLPESDAIVYVHLKTLRAATHFDQSPAGRSPDLQSFIDATGIVPERDLDSAAFAFHRLPLAPLAYPTRGQKVPSAELFLSEVFIGRFDGQRLQKYLKSVASSHETYAGRDVYSIPLDGQTLRVAQLAYDTIAASNMPTSEQIHSMLDRSRASALSTSGSSLLTARFHEVPLLAEAWGIGHIGLPFAQNGYISVMGLQLPLPEDTDLIASLSYNGAVHLRSGGSVHLRIVEIAPDSSAAKSTVETLTTLLGILRGIGNEVHAGDPAASAIRSVLDSISLTQHSFRAQLDANASLEELKALATASHDPSAIPAIESNPSPQATPAPAAPSK